MTRKSEHTAVTVHTNLIMSHITLPAVQQFENWKWITDSPDKEKKSLCDNKIAYFSSFDFLFVPLLRYDHNKKAKHFSLFQHTAVRGEVRRVAAQDNARYVLFNFLLPVLLRLRRGTKSTIALSTRNRAAFPRCCNKYYWPTKWKTVHVNCLFFMFYVWKIDHFSCVSLFDGFGAVCPGDHGAESPE